MNRVCFAVSSNRTRRHRNRGQRNRCQKALAGSEPIRIDQGLDSIRRNRRKKVIGSTAGRQPRQEGR
jgi:hypothetical protein